MKAIPLILLLASVASGQRAVVRSAGQFDRDGSILYSVYLASGQEDLEGITLSAAIPPGTRYYETIHKPQDGIYEGVKSDVVFWRVPRLERDSLLGPFVFRVKPDGSARTMPQTIPAAVAFERPSVELIESPPSEGVLSRLADRGTLVIDQRGTIDIDGHNAPLFIGDTGAAIFVPEGAVSQRTTLTIERQPVDERKLPQTDPATWWCSLYKVSSDPEVRFSKPVSFAFPSRRPLTPGLPVSLFTTTDLDRWERATGDEPGKGTSPRDIGFGVGSFGGGFGCRTIQFMTVCGGGSGFGFGGFGAFGYVEQDNIVSKTKGSQLSTLGPTAAAALSNPPGIIAILIGIR